MIDLAARDSLRRAWIEDSLRSTDVVWTAPALQEGESDAVSPEAAFEDSTRARLALMAVLRSVTAEQWVRPMGHATRGARALADWVREWADEDNERFDELRRLMGDRK